VRNRPHSLRPADAELDGFEVVRHVRLDSNLSDMRIVAVTACAMRDDHDKVMAAGFDGYITKPIVRKSSSAAQRVPQDDLRSVLSENQCSPEPQPAPGTQIRELPYWRWMIVG